MIDFKSQADAMKDELIARRRDFHQYPELAFEEVRTSGIIAEELKKLGLDVQTGIAKTGVVAMLEGTKKPSGKAADGGSDEDNAGPTVLYRADMDALPINEANNVDYASKNPDRMHACGHDGHMTIALGVAKLMAQHRDKIAGRIKFVFQPGEEGAGGALAMIKEGVLDDPEPDVSLGLHIWQPLRLGTVGVAEGPTMSGSSVFKIVIRGKSGHAAMPHTTVDPVACSGQLITALNMIVGRKMDAMAGAVILSVTGVKTSSYAHNIIPDNVEITGTFRTFNAYTSEMLEQHIRDVSHSVCESVGCVADVTVRHLTIPVVNHPEVVNRVQTAFQNVISPEQFNTTTRTMASEDMAYYMDDIPGMFVLLGSSNPDEGLTFGHHHPRFNFDENVLPLGVALMCSALADYLMPGERDDDEGMKHKTAEMEAVETDPQMVDNRVTGTHLAEAFAKANS